MYERFTDRARKVCVLANQTANEFGCAFIGTSHLLIGLLKEKSGVACHVLRELGMDLESVIAIAEESATRGVNKGGRLPHAPRTSRSLEFAIEAANKLNHSYVGTEHILLGLLREPEGAAGEIMRRLGVSDLVVEAQIMKILGVSSIKHLEDKITQLKTTIEVTHPKQTEPSNR